jgi:drug/metabolite transporter (DMT)-like permease
VARKFIRIIVAIAADSCPMPADRFKLILSLLATYLVWGSTYLAIRIGVESFPPLMLAALRFLLAGGSMYLWLRLRGVAAPSPLQWRNAALIGGMMLTIANGSVTYAEKTVSSGLAALVVGLVPLLTVLAAWIWGARPSRREWLGIGIGLLGVIWLSTGQQLRTSPQGAFLLVLASLSWAFASVWMRRLEMPVGPMSVAAQMLLAGGQLALLSLLHGEQLQQWPDTRAWAALMYLVVFGSILAYSAFFYLLNTVRPALASSYAYVNPPIAVLLGWAFAGESLGINELLAMPLICLAVLFVANNRGKV